MAEIVKFFKKEHVRAVQICYDTIRVTFLCPEIFKKAKEHSGLYLFGMWCNILGGGPPVTIIHLFDYPFEEEDSAIEEVFSDFGEVKRVKHQSYIASPGIFTGTRLISIVLRQGVNPPRFVTVNGYHCRIWYRGQPLICNLCGVQGHKSANCPNKDKCRRCGNVGHFARSCPNPWGVNPPAGNVPPADNNDNPDPPAGEGSIEDPPVVSGDPSADPPADSSAGPPEGPPVDLPADPPADPPVDPSASSSAVSAEDPPIDPPAVLPEDSPPVEEYHDAFDGSDMEIGAFPSQSQPLFSESSESIGSFSGSQSILADVNNVDIVVVDDNEVEQINEIIVVEEGHNVSEITNNDKDNENVANNGIVNERENAEPNGSSINNERVAINVVNEKENAELNGNSNDNESSVSHDPPNAEGGSSMDLDSSGASRKRSLEEDEPDPVPLRAPRPARRKRIQKAPNIPSGQARHSNLPSVVSNRPSRT